MAKPTQRHTIDLSASAARVRSARDLASAQARHVMAAADGADALSIDLLFLLQESVLVMTDTHVMLETLAKMEARKREPATRAPSLQRPSVSGQRLRTARRALASAAAIVLAVVVATWALEILDPAPMDVEASNSRILHTGR